MTLLKLIPAVIFSILLTGCGSDSKDKEGNWEETYYVAQYEIDEFTRGEGVGIWTSALFYAQERVGFNDFDTQPQPDITLEDIRQSVTEDYICDAGDTEALYCYQSATGLTDTYQMNWDPDDTGTYQTTITLGKTWVEIVTKGEVASQYCLRKEYGVNYEDPDSQSIIENLSLSANPCRSGNKQGLE